MTENSFQSIQLFFCDQQKGESGQFIPTHKDEEASTLTTTKDKKLLKNKISAQNSRLKKKKYIQELENKQKILMQEIKNTDLQIQKAKHQLNIFLTKNKENDSFNHDEKPTYERLKKLIRVEQHFDEDEANMLIELLINRIGVTGKERRRMVEYYTKRLVNFSIPAIYRYFLQASTEDKGILSNTMQDLYGWDKELYQKLNLDPLRKQKLEKMRSKIKSEKEVWVRQIQDFNLIQSKIYTVSAQVEEQLLTLRYLFNTRQTGQIIIGVENRKYNKEISLFKDPVMSSPVKKVKKE